MGEDLNQDGIYDATDLYGVLTWNDPTTAILACSGERIATVNDKGMIELTLYNERVVNLYDRYFDLVFDQAHVYNYQYDNVTGKQSPSAVWNTDRDSIFNEGRAVFYMNTVGTVERHRDSQTDFGVLPYPKLRPLGQRIPCTVRLRTRACRGFRAHGHRAGGTGISGSAASHPRVL